MPDARPILADHVHILKDEFRRHLGIFYAGLKLTPPYESVEKAIRMLTTTVGALPKDELSRIASNPVLRWQQFQLAFEQSGLAKKHYGIIAGLARNRSALDLSAEYNHFLSLFITYQSRFQGDEQGFSKASHSSS